MAFLKRILSRIVFCETILCKEKARQRRKNNSDIEASLRTCVERCNESPSAENQEQLEMLQMEYDSIYEEIAKGAIIRSKATWYEKGEKSQ